MDVLLCDRMRLSWRELQEIPAWVVEDYLMVMRAETQKARRDAEELRRRSSRSRR